VTGITEAIQLLTFLSGHHQPRPFVDQPL